MIVIKTKKGKAGRLSVNYSGGLSFKPRMTYNKLELMNSKERVEVSREAFQKNIPLQYNENVGYAGLAKQFRNREITLEEFSEGVRQLEMNNTDWLDILTRNVLSHHHYIGLSGGTEHASYNGSVGATFNNNVAKGNDQKQYTANMSMSSRLWENISLSISLSGSVAETKAFNTTDPYTYATTTNRALPFKDENGELV